MNGDSSSVRGFIKNLAIKIKLSPSLLKEDEISSIMIGLHGMNPRHHPEVIDLVEALKTKFKLFKGELSVQCIASCVYGLRWFDVNINNDNNNVKDIDFKYSDDIAVVSERCTVVMNEFVQVVNIMIAEYGIKDTSNPITSQGVAMAMKGLQKMGSDSFTSRQMIKNILPYLHIEDNDQYGHKQVGFSPVEVGVAIRGLQHMDAIHTEVRELMKALIMYIRAGEGQLSSLDLGIALSGMRRFSNADPLVADLFTALLKRTDKNSLSKDPQAVSVALAAHGMQNFIIPNPMLYLFVQQLEKCYEKKEILNAQGLGMLIYGLSHTLNQNVNLKRAIDDNDTDNGSDDDNDNDRAGGDEVQIALMNMIEKHTRSGNFIVDGRAASLAYKAFHRINDQDLSYELMDKIESTLVELMRKLDRTLLLNDNLDKSEEQFEKVLDQRESNRFFNSMRYLGKISSVYNALPPAPSWLPILVGFFLLNEQLQQYSCDAISYMT